MLRRSVESTIRNGHKQLTAENVFLNHLEAMKTEVTPPDPKPYKELGKTLAELAKLQERTNTVKKALQIASASSIHTRAKRAKVSKRTTKAPLSWADWTRLSCKEI